MIGPGLSRRAGGGNPPECPDGPGTALQGSATGVDCRSATYGTWSTAGPGGSATVGSRKAPGGLARNDGDGDGTGAACGFAAAVQRGAGGVVLPQRRPPGGRPLLLGHRRLRPCLQPPPRPGAGRRQPRPGGLAQPGRPGPGGPPRGPGGRARRRPRRRPAAGRDPRRRRSAGVGTTPASAGTCSSASTRSEPTSRTSSRSSACTPSWRRPPSPCSAPPSWSPSRAPGWGADGPRPR
jgi:hypothetical protein